MKKLLIFSMFFAIYSGYAQDSSLVKKAEKSDSTRYRYLLGTNFDLIDGLDAKGLSHHVNITLPNAFNKKNGWIKKSGFIAGIYQNKQVSVIDTINYSNRGNNLRQNVAYPSDDPSYVRIIRVDSANLQKKSMTKSFGLYLQRCFNSLKVMIIKHNFM